MDYEKKYKEALERFKTFREKYCTYGELHFGDVIFDKTGEAQKDLDAIFPELKESGDERMIKAIEHILYENYSDAAVIEGVEIAEIVTWLEKHKEPIDPFDTKLFQDGVKEGRRLEREDIKKEQQSAESISRLAVKGKGVYKICPRCKERMVRDDSKVFTSMPPQYGYKCPKCGEMEFDTVMYDSPEIEEQKPAEWSEEDEKIMQTMIKDGDLKPSEVAWLKSLPERFNLEPKQEWSEEDERILKGIIGLIDHDQHYGVSNNEMISWLKSLRPSWKPSEEQPQVADASKMEQEVDLEKEIDAVWNPRFNLGWDEHSCLTMNRAGFESFARHFAEWGAIHLNARKEE